MSAYLVMMAIRLLELQRVLKDTGSLYLHCDPTASHYLKLVLDSIFGEQNFQNEIVWCYTGGGASTRRFAQKHDTIFFYTKSKNYKFNTQYLPYKEHSPYHSGGEPYREEGKVMEDYWLLNRLGSTSEENLGYPTQKPVALLERIVKASSKKGDIVFDPFCGCGTTLIASQRLERRWIGIDVSPTACKLMQKRLKKELSFSAPIISGAVDMKYVKKLNPYDFQNWVVVDKFLGTVSRTKSGDMGIDGVTAQINGGYPIQVKQSEDIGRNVIDNFETAMRRMNKKKGYVVAFSFGKGAYEEVARVKNQEDLDITLRTIQDLLDGKSE